MAEHMPARVTIREVIRESPTVSTLIFDRSFSFRPGQFVMVWVPGVDEIPMALSSASSITVQNVGDATSALTGLPPRAAIGIRGPFGNGFPVEKNTLAVAGGVGAAPLLPLAEAGAVGTFVIGAKSGSEILFRDRLKAVTDLVVMTDDGSLGKKGFAAEGMDGLDIGSFSQVCVCGPERMMYSVFQKLEIIGLPERGQFSLHRYMKCGSGVCGSCCIDPAGARVCRDGPVFPGDFLSGSEFGSYSRDGSGRRKPV
jgi:dihydroorotate dehydrogenase electron transfer subunit